ncbi:LysE family translocator [Actinomadura sp. KC06]|uniref:LysE family translocator n=1 Tax=Actinomadura sp. KC06 TaxID=2530369 RepID=UPI0010453FE9|nr:LysE family translocator [Actinomadura sp. KC06]TDD33155.1 LysE family translocator [Actinomadura sp. KC06]
MLDGLAAFAAASLLVSMAPGPTTVVIMRQSVRFGRPAGTAAVLGNETGWLLWSVTAALGLSAVLLASRLAYDVMRIAGAVVLVCLGARMLWRARRGTVVRSGDDVAVQPGPSWWRSYRLGLMTNLANPKAAVFAVSFLPQFVPAGASVPATLLLLALASTLIDLGWYIAIVSLITRAKRFLQRPAIRRRLEYLSGTVLIGLALRLATEAR